MRHAQLSKGRLEAFSDGVFAIIITIMVLELRVPHGTDFAALLPILPVLLSYVLSFTYVAIYWNNHHHMLQAATHVTGSVMWANMHLLFWLSLVPFVTGFMGENHAAPIPVALYGTALFMCGVAYYLLARALVQHHGAASALARAMGNGSKERWSLVLYAVAIAAAMQLPWLSVALYIFVAIMWVIPDRRIERALGS